MCFHKKTKVKGKHLYDMYQSHKHGKCTHDGFFIYLFKKVPYKRMIIISSNATSHDLLMKWSYV